MASPAGRGPLRGRCALDSKAESHAPHAIAPAYVLGSTSSPCTRHANQWLGPESNGRIRGYGPRAGTVPAPELQPGKGDVGVVSVLARQPTGYADVEAPRLYRRPSVFLRQPTSVRWGNPAAGCALRSTSPYPHGQSTRSEPRSPASRGGRDSVLAGSFSAPSFALPPSAPPAVGN